MKQTNAQKPLAATHIDIILNKIKKPKVILKLTKNKNKKYLRFRVGERSIERELYKGGKKSNFVFVKCNVVEK